MTSTRARLLLPALLAVGAVGAVGAVSACSSGSRTPASATTAPGLPVTSAAATATAAAPSTVPASTTSTSASPAPAHPVHDVTIAFGGDVHFMGVDANRLAADPSTAIGPIASVLSKADLAMVNLETAVTTRGTPVAKQYVFRAPASAFTALRSAGIDVATMANNHGEDYGPVGLADSLAAAAAARFPVVGVGRDVAAAFAPYQVTVKGQRIAVIGATQVLDNNLAAAWTAGPDKAGLASAYDVPRLVAAVAAARAQADTVVVYLHWGKELATCPTANQRTIAQQLVDAGADIVVGSHAHVLLGAGHLGSAYVDYGLGNFVFYSAGGVTSRSGVLVLTVRGRTVVHDAWVPAQVQRGVPVPLAGQAATDATAQWRQLASCTGLLAG